MKTFPQIYCIVACVSLLLHIDSASAQSVPADPSFSSSVDETLLTHVFGYYNVGDPDVTFDFSVYNRPAAAGTTSPMTLFSITPFGNTSAISLQTGAVVGVLAGGQSAMQLTLSTSQPGNFVALYSLEFVSEGLPAAPHQSLVISTNATVLAVPEPGLTLSAIVAAGAAVFCRRSRNDFCQ